MATNPATAPAIAPSALTFLLRNHSAAHQPIAAAAAPKCVATNALVARVPEPRALPALNPNQPTHNMQAPTKLRTTLYGGIVSLGYPSLRRRYSAQTNAETPEVTWTTVQPEKSNLGHRPRHAALRRTRFPHTKCPM